MEQRSSETPKTLGDRGPELWAATGGKLVKNRTWKLWEGRGVRGEATGGVELGDVQAGKMWRVDTTAWKPTKFKIQTQQNGKPRQASHTTGGSRGSC